MRFLPQVYQSRFMGEHVSHFPIRSVRPKKVLLPSRPVPGKQRGSLLARGIRSTSRIIGTTATRPNRSVSPSSWRTSPRWQSIPWLLRTGIWPVRRPTSRSFVSIRTPLRRTSRPPIAFPAAGIPKPLHGRTCQPFSHPQRSAKESAAAIPACPGKTAGIFAGGAGNPKHIQDNWNNRWRGAIPALRLTQETARLRCFPGWRSGDLLIYKNIP